ncbi:GNAT family N-acetyltransferase [Brevibacillus humidisoli]|uniref:GNAT family N-acetyltransferase n=1 Tax=Brevibacillus humidisoli TaxID=2895522 RepID=UPI001E32A9AD|nr:GNAT family N-acetyltransferase [Brevibacillus humidisoli]UFJ41122.1 GNAT family N-acetyltransferase [Brevibacillus humidisoli]
MEVRTPTEGELELILQHSPQAAFEGTMGRTRPTFEKIKQLVESLLQQGGRYVVAVEENQLAGWVLFGARQDQFSDQWFGFIYELYVLPEHRGKGVSKRLMREAIEQLSAEGYREVRLSVYVENHAKRLYEQLGFVDRNITMSLHL